MGYNVGGVDRRLIDAVPVNPETGNRRRRRCAAAFSAICWRLSPKLGNSTRNIQSESVLIENWERFKSTYRNGGAETHSWHLLLLLLLFDFVSVDFVRRLLAAILNSQVSAHVHFTDQKLIVRGGFLRCRCLSWAETAPFWPR